MHNISINKKSFVVKTMRGCKTYKEKFIFNKENKIEVFNKVIAYRDNEHLISKKANTGYRYITLIKRKSKIYLTLNINNYCKKYRSKTIIRNKLDYERVLKIYIQKVIYVLELKITLPKNINYDLGFNFLDVNGLEEKWFSYFVTINNTAFHAIARDKCEAENIAIDRYKNEYIQISSYVVGDVIKLGIITNDNYMSKMCTKVN